MFNDPNSSISYQQGGGAADGTDYLRITTTGTKQFFSRTAAITTATGNTQLEPNCRYRITVSVRRDRAGFVHEISLDEGGGASSGNSAIEYYFPEVEVDRGSPGDPINSWFDTSLEYTTSPAGIYSKNWFIRLQGFANTLPSDLPSGSVIEFDNVRLELLERLPAATLQVGNGASLQYFSGTDCNIQFVTSTGGTKNISVTKNSGAPTNIGSALVPGKYWTIEVLTGSVGAFTARPIFSYTDLELSTAGINEGDLRLIRRPGSGDGWTEVPATINTTANTAQPVDPVSSFSEWALATPGFPLATTVEDWTQY